MKNLRKSEIHRIAVIGAGIMGHSIAQDFALAGYDVALNARSEESLARARGAIEGDLKRLVGLGVITGQKAATVLPRIRTTPVLEEAVRDADAVFESVFEDVVLKTEIFQQLDALSPPHAILASNTSSLRMSDFVGGIGRRDKALMTHYINPPHLVPLVEVTRTEHTSEETIETICTLLTRAGKRPVRLEQEIPGFIVNRLQAAMVREALSLVDKGVISAEGLDAVIKTSFGRRWAVAGIFEVWELVGWDLVLAACGGLLPDLESGTELAPLLKKMVDRGDLGVKSGKGFYQWTPEEAEAVRHRIAQALVKIDKFD